MLLGPKEFSIIWTGHRPKYCPWTALVGSLYYLWASSPFLSPRLHLFGYFSVLGHHASLCRGRVFCSYRERERERKTLLSWCHGTWNCCLWVRQAAFFLVSLFTHNAKTERYMHRFHWCHFLWVDASWQELHGCLYRSKCALLKLHGRQWSNSYLYLVKKYKW
jgi:hypothetical protein